MRTKLKLGPSPLEHRFWASVQKTDSCWLWIGCINAKGYGVIKRNYVRVPAHRLSWEINNGTLSDVDCVLHKCDVRNCVRPDHLFLGSRSENNEDRDRKGRQAKGDRTNTAKLSDEDVTYIRLVYERYTHGSQYNTVALAKKFGVTDALIGKIVRREVWKHLP